VYVCRPESSTCLPATKLSCTTTNCTLYISQCCHYHLAYAAPPYPDIQTNGPLPNTPTLAHAYSHMRCQLLGPELHKGKPASGIHLDLSHRGGIDWVGDHVGHGLVEKLNEKLLWVGGKGGRGEGGEGVRVCVAGIRRVEKGGKSHAILNNVHHMKMRLHASPLR
jgi:hypothetical protein